MGGGSLGSLRLAKPIQIQRSPVLGQPANRLPEPAPREEVTDLPPEEAGQARESIWRRRAWGKFRKLDAAEMATYLKQIEERMGAAGIPPGIVEQIRRRLESFVDSNVPDNQEVTLDEHEVVALDNAIMYLEQTEASSSPNFGAAAAVVAGLGLLAMAVVG
jgi:hypothetical protein